ncbi:hypothetical protein ACGF0D_12620 [Kitasatospora sp. NPDC048298]|uniref:hypothetical protein n=1 Tax=Kitasatospora sp. NPDC048298 TaxID=3364049 RepID=UPI00371D8A5F
MTDPTDTSSRTAAEKPPAAYAPRVDLIRGAMEVGETVLAARLAEELHQHVALERGATHPEALRAQEVRAYVAAVGGDPGLAADLFTGTATAWADQGASEQWAASRNAEVCRRRVELLESEPSAEAGAGRPPLYPSPARAFGRGAVVAVVLATALLSGAADAGPRAYLGMGPRPALDDQPVAPAVVGALKHSAPSASPAPVPAPPPPEPTAAEPVPTPEAVPTEEQETPAAEPGEDGARPGQRPHFPGAHPRPRPAPSTARPPGGPAADANTDPCAAARVYGGQFLGSLVELCQRAAGASGRRSPAP